ncbi:MAG: sensor histidine kinase [Leadbetterella sp.]|nr:sensor histidine kinase [Leadbetterella sp.]
MKIKLVIFFFFTGWCCLAQSRETKMDSLINVGNKMPLDSNKVKNRVKISELYRGVNNKKAEEFALEAIQTGRKIKWVAHYPNLYLNLSKVHNVLGNYLNAIEILDSTLKYAGNQSDCICYPAEYQLQYLFNYSYSGQYDKAYQHGIKALKLAEETQNQNQIARINLRLGEVRQNLNDFEGAVKNYEASMEVCRKNNFEYILNLNRWMLAKVYIDHFKDHPKAYKLQKELILSYRQLKDSSQLSGALNTTANGLIKNSRFSEAKVYLLEAYEIAQKVNYKLFTQYICFNLGKVALTEKRFDDAKRYFDEGLKIARETNDKDALATVTNDLSNYYFVTHDFPKAFAAEFEVESIRGSTRSKAVMNSVADAEIKYQTERKEKVILEQELQIANQRNWILAIIGAAGIALLVVLLIYTNHQAKQKAQFAAEKLKLQTGITSAIVEAEETERIRLAKELHDGVGPMLSLAKIQLETAMNQTQFHSIEQESLFKNANTMIDDAASEIRTVSHDLMPNALLMHGLVSAVREFVNRLSLTGKVKISLDVANLDERLPQLTETVLYRVLQELIGNVIKHSEASSVQIQLIRHDYELIMVIEDDGKGFDTSQMANFKGIGLKNIISRIDFLHGKVNFDSNPHRGTTVIVEVPV